jgi:acetyl esterase/lipase
MRMPAFAVSDWDDAYANMANVVDGEAYTDKWAGAASGFRDGMAGRMQIDLRYGGGERCTYDHFAPQGTAKGTLIFIHGGYWMRFDKSSFSHLATGALARGWAVAMPQYPLCPQVRVRDITRRMVEAVTAIAKANGGPITLAGHSAGGHLASRMVCEDSALPASVRDRIRAVVSISGVHDLRPLLRTGLNQTLHLDETEAREESPALLRPAMSCALTCWAGANERSEFIRQNELLANIWRGLGVATACVAEPDRQHFSVVEGLIDPDHPLTQIVTGQ